MSSPNDKKKQKPIVFGNVLMKKVQDSVSTLPGLRPVHDFLTLKPAQPTKLQRRIERRFLRRHRNNFHEGAVKEVAYNASARPHVGYGASSVWDPHLIKQEEGVLTRGARLIKN